MSIRESLGKLFRRGNNSHLVDHALQEVGFVPDPDTVLGKSERGICAHCGASLPDVHRCPENSRAGARLRELGVNMGIGTILKVHDCPLCRRPVKLVVLSPEPLHMKGVNPL